MGVSYERRTPAHELFSIVEGCHVLPARAWNGAHRNGRRGLFSILLGWGILGLIAIFLLINLTSLNTQFKHAPELSAKANEYLQKYSHYYAYPHVCRQLSGAASVVAIFGIILTIISLVKGFYLGLLFGAAAWWVGSYLGPLFYPVNAPIKGFDRQAHESVVYYVESRRSDI